MPLLPSAHGHPLVGAQLDRALHRPTIIDDADKPGGRDVELVVVLDDWIDGMGRTPDSVLLGRQGSGMRMGGADRSAGAGACPGSRTDIVLGGRTIGVDFEADNPVQRATQSHCSYHEAGGMMTTLSYRT